MAIFFFVMYYNQIHLISVKLILFLTENSQTLIIYILDWRSWGQRKKILQEILVKKKLIDTKDFKGISDSFYFIFLIT